MASRLSSLADHIEPGERDRWQPTVRYDTQAIRVMIVDDHLMTVEALQAYLAWEPGIEVVATALEGSTALERLVEHRPDGLGLDLNMPGRDGVEGVPGARLCGPRVAIPVLTGCRNGTS